MDLWELEKLDEQGIIDDLRDNPPNCLVCDELNRIPSKMRLLIVIGDDLRYECKSCGYDVRIAI